MNRSLALALNTLALYALAGVLVAAFAMQFALDELPCPLCLLQRAFFSALAIGPILNLRYGPHPLHYALSMLAALAGAAVSVRQILLHIMPGDPGYGSAIFGYHYYTWAFILFAAALLALAVMMLFERQFEPEEKPQPAAASMLALWLVIALTLANVASTLAICGLTACPDNPVSYAVFGTNS
jgi:disulfide bond formation protein DsbB